VSTLRNSTCSGRESPRYARSRAQVIPRDTYPSSNVSQLTATPHVIPGQADPGFVFRAPRQISGAISRPHNEPSLDSRVSEPCRKSPLDSHLAVRVIASIAFRNQARHELDKASLEAHSVSKLAYDSIWGYLSRFEVIPTQGRRLDLSYMVNPYGTVRAKPYNASRTSGRETSTARSCLDCQAVPSGACCLERLERSSI
jgi:hypothetical protein